MPEDRLSQLRKGYAEEDHLSLEPPDLGRIRALAETAEFAEAMARLADAYGRPLPADDPLAPLARDIARALTEAGFTLPTAPRAISYRLGDVCLMPAARGGLSRSDILRRRVAGQGLPLPFSDVSQASTR